MIHALQQLDEQILLTLNGVHTPLADVFMYTFSGRWVWVPLYVVLAWYVVRSLGWRNGLITVAAIGLAVTIADQTCASLIRPWAERLRPAHPDNPLSQSILIVNGYRGGNFGFPSCHAANTFALAVYLVLLCRKNKLWLPMFLWASMNCYSRMYLGVHYPGDILVGASVGSLAAAVVYFAVQRVFRIGNIEGGKWLWPVYAVLGASVLGIAIYAALADVLYP